MSRKRQGQHDRTHSRHIVKVSLGRPCSRCHRRIQYLPSDVDPRYARFCLHCRDKEIPIDTVPDNWLGRGEAEGAATGFYIFG